MRLATVTGPAGTTAAVQDGDDWLALPAPDLSTAYATGVLEPGGSAEGTWVFSRPSGSQGSVEVAVGSISSSSVVVVRS